LRKQKTIRRAADKNLPVYQHNAPASEQKNHLLALRAGIFLPGPFLPSLVVGSFLCLNI
jgi:hypothetical protein